MRAICFFSPVSQTLLYVILGGTGHMGSAVADTLLQRGQPVTILTNDETDSAQWQAKGATVAMADVYDVDGLAKAFRRGRRAFLLNPPAATTTDTDVVERLTIANIVAALKNSGLEKVVVESSIWARPGEHLGDNNTLWELEEGARKSGIPVAINRAPFYLTNWDAAFKLAQETGVFETIYPADIRLPIADPRDIGRFGADCLLSDVSDVGIRYIEGPARYSSTDFAATFKRALGHPVELNVIPPAQWEESFRTKGFFGSPKFSDAADSYTRMSNLAIFDDFTIIKDPLVGSITLPEHLKALTAHS